MITVLDGFSIPPVTQFRLISPATIRGSSWYSQGPGLHKIREANSQVIRQHLHISHLRVSLIGELHQEAGGIVDPS